MRDHHRELIAREAENWRVEPRQPTTTRMVALDEMPGGLLVSLSESANRSIRTTSVFFDGDEMPLSPRMVKDRLANPFGGTP